MAKRKIKAQGLKSYQPSARMKSFLNEGIKLLERGNSHRTWQRKKVSVLDNMFQSLADMIYFLETTASNPELHEVFRKDLKDFFDMRAPRQAKQLHTLFGVNFPGAHLVETAFTRLIFATIVPHEDPGDEAFQTYRLKLLDILQSIIYTKMWFVLRHTFGVNNQVTKSALDDLKTACGWTAMVGRADYEKDYTPKRILDFPSPYSPSE